MCKVIHEEALEYCRNKSIIKPKKIPYDRNRFFFLFELCYYQILFLSRSRTQKISQGITKQRLDYPTMEDICSDWKSNGETEQMTKQSKMEIYHESKKPILKHQIREVQQQRTLNCHQNT
uniref:Uncharacterized protein n=1 Tax=Onchocerca volvulus TaxID=6282 RepID=A0A8R1XZF7_ONCVO